MVERVESLPQLARRPVDGHKGTFGRVVVLAGSVGMSGAASLAGLGALRGGAGLVYVACPDVVLPTVAAAEPSYLTIPLPSDPQTGGLPEGCEAAVLEACRGKDVVAVGPGLGNRPGTRAAVRAVLNEVRQPVVVDADGINVLAGHPEWLRSDVGPRVLTPHPGEFARLTGLGIAEVQRRREELAVRFAREHNAVVVLKGHRTVVTDGNRVAVNPTGNPGMATGGSGDVLTGLLAALLGQGLSAFEASQLAVYLHGLAGDLAAEQLSEQALIASDLVRFLPQAWQRLRS